jgi:preprotein translocase subunit SecA
LRGRAGRQGDPGSSRFFLSLEDKTFRLFGGDRLTNLMQTFRLGDDIPLESKQVTKTLNQVQIKVEEYFNSIRSSLLEFDEILATQRDTIYSLRAKILTGDQADSEILLTEWCVDTMKDLLRSSTDDDEVVDVVAVHTKVSALRSSAADRQIFDATRPSRRRSFSESTLRSVQTNLHSWMRCEFLFTSPPFSQRKPCITCIFTASTT